MGAVGNLRFKVANQSNFTQAKQHEKPWIPLELGDRQVGPTLPIVVVVVKRFAPTKNINGKQVRGGVAGIHDLISDHVTQPVDDNYG